MYYDQSQQGGDNRYMQALKRNPINRGIRSDSDSDYESNLNNNAVKFLKC